MRQKSLLMKKYHIGTNAVWKHIKLNLNQVTFPEMCEGGV